jgi:oligopeptide/dipeptide ABC transporter ATP-binding protein
LDVTIQAQVLSLLFDLRASHRMGMIFITHDLGVVAQVAERVGVMYAGQIVELASAKDLFTSPGHPYSQALLSSLPRLDRDGQQLKSIPGLVPSLNLMPQGCRFAPRCPVKMDICQQERPELTIFGSSGETEHLVRCWLGEGG